MSEKIIIYDFGANNGDDIPYYLKKADRVVAIDANPALTRAIQARFSAEIAEGRLYVENCVVTADEQGGDVLFYLHKTNHVISQFPKPSLDILDQFEEVRLPAKSVRSLIDRHGPPFYIKIDIEHYDEPLLEAVFKNGIRPQYISAEAHNLRIFLLLLSLGRYDSFKLVDGSTVAWDYRNAGIATKNGQERYSFPDHSAGPFGDDIKGQWMSTSHFMLKMALFGFGWRDIHATNIKTASPNARLSTMEILQIVAYKRLKIDRVKVRLLKLGKRLSSVFSKKTPRSESH